MSLVLLDRTDPVARLTLNRPERHNSLVPELLRDLLEAVIQIAAQPEIRAVVLAANGPSFSTGGDAFGFVQHNETIGDYAGEVVGLLNEAILALLDLPLPVVVSVHGPVTGGSMGLVLAADIVLVAPEATFTPYYSVIGPSPDGGWTAMLPEIIGPKRAAAVLMLNEPITAAQAVEWGLAFQMVPGEFILDKAMEVARTLASRKPGSIHHTRRLLNRDRDRIAAGLSAERDRFVTHIVTPEAAGGFAAFVANLRAMKGLHVGQTAVLTRVFTTEEVAEYRALSGDHGLGFGGADAADATVPGPLVAGLFSCLLGTDLPGRGTNWLKQTLAYARPAPAGEPLTATVEITRLRPEKALVNLRTTCRTKDGDLICDGEALVLVRDRAYETRPVGESSTYGQVEVSMA